MTWLFLAAKAALDLTFFVCLFVCLFVRLFVCLFICLTVLTSLSAILTQRNWFRNAASLSEVKEEKDDGTDAERQDVAKRSKLTAHSSKHSNRTILTSAQQHDLLTQQVCDTIDTLTERVSVIVCWWVGLIVCLFICLYVFFRVCRVLCLRFIMKEMPLKVRTPFFGT